MKTFPIHALSRPYTLGYPQAPVLASGVVGTRLGNGRLRVRDEFGQDIVARDVRIEAITAADKTILDNFRTDHRAATFYFADNKTYLTYEAVFDPDNPPQVTPRGDMIDRYDYQARILPAIPTVAVDMLVGHWKMNDNAADTDVADASGNGHTGTASQNTEDMTATGKINEALDFNGTDDYVNITGASALRLTDGGTIMAWIEPDGLGGGSVGRIADKGTTTSATNGFMFYVYANNVLAFRVDAASNNTTSSANAFSLDAWTHVAVVFTAEGRTLYADGVDVTASGGDETGLPPDVAGDLRIGNRAGATDRAFDGAIDDVRIYKRPLTQLEIQAIYNSGSGTESAIVA